VTHDPATRRYRNARSPRLVCRGHYPQNHG
jgi:hypothetical protein